MSYINIGINMRLKILIFLGIMILSASAFAGKYDASITSGVFGGVPFWNKENFSEEFAMDSSSKFLRWVNSITANGYYDNLSFHLSGSRSDGFDIRDDFPESNKYQVHLFGTKYHFSDTRIYRAYAQYKFDGGYVRAGRLPSFNRWLFGSVDGGALSCNITDNLNISGYGGKGVKYGLLYDDEYENIIGYADISYNRKDYGLKAKYMYSDSSTKAGMDLFGNFSGIRTSLNFGYDITNKYIYDGSLAIFAYLTKDLSLSANVSRFRIITPFANFTFNNTHPIGYIPDYIKNIQYVDRFIIGASYKLFADYSLNFRQMLSTRLEQTDYLSYLYLNQKYFFIGVNYLSGDSGNERLGISLGGNYSPMDGLRLNAGIASVDYMLGDYDDESTQSITTYLQCSWNILEELMLRTNLNYYHNNDVFPQKIRGGLSLQYNFKSGEQQ